jgi:hypothetical protein
MSPTPAQARIVEYPFAKLMQGGRLDSYIEKGRELLLEVHGLDVTASDVFERDGKLSEKVTGRYIPLKLTFLSITPISRADFFITLGELPADDPSRTISTLHTWTQPGMDDIFHALSMRITTTNANVNFFAREAEHEMEDGGEPFTFERDWSPAPPMPGVLVPQPQDVYDHFGGDPVTVHIDGKTYEDKLFVGGLEHQPDDRPDGLTAVLNLGERPSAWVKGTDLNPNDRTVEKGEGTLGMSTAEIRAEANWVIDHIKKDESVLVHCVAGMNRSVTICCAVLMLTENLTAAEALARVREHHPWAKPDSYHWLALRWLEKNNHASNK